MTSSTWIEMYRLKQIVLIILNKWYRIVITDNYLSHYEFISEKELTTFFSSLILVVDNMTLAMDISLMYTVH